MGRYKKNKWDRKDLRLDLTGERFNMLEVLSFSGIDKNGQSLWKCKCDCGKVIDRIGKEIKRGRVRSCGCLKGHVGTTKHGDCYSVFYKRWCGMKRRCKFNSTYKDVDYISSWEDYENFKKDMYFKWVFAKKKYRVKDKDLTLERKDNYKGYCKSNCEFIPKNKQQGNRKCNLYFKAISPEGKEYVGTNASKFAKEHWMYANRVRECIRGELKQYRGWKFINLRKMKWTKEKE